MVCADEIDLLNDVEHLIQKHLPREIIEGFVPVNSLPESRTLRPLKAKKPKKAKIDHKDGQRSGDNARGHKPTGKNRRHTGNNTNSGNKGNGDRRRINKSRPNTAN